MTVETATPNVGLLECSPDCAKLLDRDGHVLFMNYNGQCVMEIDDFSFFRGKLWWQFWPDAMRGALQDAVAAAGEGKTARFTAECPTAKGTLKWWDVTVAAVPDSTDILAISRDITDQKRFEERAAANIERLKRISHLSHDVMWEIDLKSREVWWSEGMQSVFGHAAESVGPDMAWCHEHIHPEDRQRVIRDMETACQTGTYWQDDFRYLRANGTYAHVEDRGMVMRDDDGNATHMIGSMRDISDRKELEDRRGLVTRELSHRMINSLAIIQAVVQQSARSESSLAEFAAAVEGRIEAMASANATLIAAEAESADLHQLIENQLSAFISADDRRVRIEGPSVEIPAVIVPTFSLGIYELATNASKYGALSVPSGSVAVTWQIVEPSKDKPRRVCVTWQESGGPKVEPPTRKGFGTILIERGLLHALVERRFEPSGVVCTIEMRLQPLSDAAPPRTYQREVGLPNGEPSVLVVEDEPLISAMLEDLLADSGFRVVASVADVASALRYLDTQANRVDLCILDVSLGDRKGFEVAERLAELGIAFLFSSGYGDVMNPTWQRVPVLRKPYSRSKLIETLQSTLAASTEGEIGHG